MTLGYVIIYVEDVKKTVSFYKKAFGLKQKFMAESGLYAEVETGETALGFVAESYLKSGGMDVRDNRLSGIPAGVEITFVSNNVAGAYRKAIDAGAVAYKEPEKKPWGQTIAYVRDCNGFLVVIGSPVVLPS